MSSRQEEKERRRKERMEREQAEAKRAARHKRMTLAFGGLLGVALIAGIVVVVLVLGGGSSSDQGTQPSEAAAKVKLPPQATSDMAAAAKAAGCTLSNPAYEGASHEDKKFKPSDYKTNPPTSGNHTPDWYEDGIYAPGDTPRLGMLVHPLEHGRIEVQYTKGTPALREDHAAEARQLAA